VQDQRRALLRAGEGDGAAKPAGCTGDHDDAAGEIDFGIC
jgi:hypothetical protein